MNAAEKCAIVMLTLGDERAAEVFKHLNTHEVTMISSAMVSMGTYTHDQLAVVMKEFRRDSGEFAVLDVNTNEYLRSVLVKALGEERANSLLEDLLEANDDRNGIETLNFMEPQMVFDLIRDEHPQIIATILVHLKRSQAADLLAKFDERERNDILLRIATFGGVQPVALQELTEVLNNLLHGQNIKRNKMGGVRPAAEILNLMKSHQEDAAIEAVREYDQELAQKIIDEMFLFENLVEMEDRSIQRILQDIDNESLIVALKGVDDALRDKFFRNMSKRQADIMRDDLNSRGPVRMSQVENEQKAILLVVRRLAETGEIVIGGGDDAYV
ncbi:MULTISPECIES: flagellar motor switch protein FliG [Kosakonia]|jgi:flagellar motor switch protein FliG|uniref:Flagellar motor switch protein FliG n=1 Tax=Kosakonia cowanii JCM 10956 = DSM 18146 TaxID=1300165 RepID=A0A807LCU2_9ENTR|nr:MULTISPECIES: flagellar motor switch protein FliG [Kosakonia]APZ04406.1 flagellar motor switch protein FliG [Kosakonia cowanii JCM 10956 = DSM 18146]MDF2624021.1 flagellar motor switch protein FliG [Kosakonia cowanii]MDM9616679.1 flagellar motor switch protein FliG [Kosakonia cowanii]MDP4561680.1 flagellar motor switch protein FliG [Kosakonia cowanii]MDY0889907.1 flagellar motor switch protein FliG [Kosakonia sp. CFBP8986]